jgi:predicted branched-subunit amino acid permease
MNWWRPLRHGAAASLPLMPGNVAWGLVFGAAATAAGLRLPGAVAMSAVAFSGTAQLAAISLLHQPLPALFLTSLLVSARFLPMSVALTGMLLAAPRWQRVLAACSVADASFALAAATRTRSPWFVAGTWLTTYSSWVAGTAAGMLAAPLLPARVLAASGGLVAVIFAVLAVEVCASRRQAAVAAAAAAGVAAATLVVPGYVALPAMAALAAALGLVVQR